MTGTHLIIDVLMRSYTINAQNHKWYCHEKTKEDPDALPYITY